MSARIALLISVLLAPLAASARPLYFDNLMALYGITPGEDLHACGVCHLRWEGTGARNPYGHAVEQQLYIGKSIVESIQAVAGDDSDLDGFSNGDELAIWRTLPGYSCSNYGSAQNPPPNLQSLLVPGLPSCLEPKDVEVEPLAVAFVTVVGRIETATVRIRNSGDTFPILVSGIALAPGAHPSFSLVTPTLPVSLDVGESTEVQVVFAPTQSIFVGTTLRVTSDDPDEPEIDVAITGISFVSPLAPPAVRGGCLKDLQKQLERLAKVRLRAWGKCYLEELRGVACNPGQRDRTVAKAEAKLRAVIGGERDTRCAAKSLSVSQLGLPPVCGAPCQTIVQNTIARVADCAVCRAGAAADAMLTAAIGTTPPDLPANLLAPTPWRCNRSLVAGIDRGIRGTQKTLGACELDAVLAGTTTDCATDRAAELAKIAADVDARAARCRDTTGLLGCLFEPDADPACLGNAASAIGTNLVQAAFGD